jgi:hypothetical protein
MRHGTLGAILGLVLGVIATVAYEHYFDLGPEVSQAKSDLASARTDFATDLQKAKSQIDGLTSQLNQVASSNDQLKQQLDQLKQKPPQATPPRVNDSVQQAHIEQELLRFKSRLNLSAEQEDALKAAMEGVVNALENHTSITKTVQQALDEILNPQQKAAYQQMLDDDEKAQADTLATSQTNQLAGLLQLTDAQKDQVYAAYYQMNLDDQKNMKELHTSAAFNDFLDGQAKEKEDAMAKILTPDELSTYTQEVESQLQAQKAAMQQAQQQNDQMEKAHPGTPVMSGAVAQ